MKNKYFTGALPEYRNTRRFIALDRSRFCVQGKKTKGKIHASELEGCSTHCGKPFATHTSIYFLAGPPSAVGYADLAGKYFQRADAFDLQEQGIDPRRHELELGLLAEADHVLFSRRQSQVHRQASSSVGPRDIDCGQS